MKSFSATSGLIAASVLFFQNVAYACNPLTAGSCPPVTALGTTVNVDFTAGASTQLPGSYNVISYESDGVHLSVTKQGDSPILISPWYIMFGRFEIVFKSATGVGMVSSAILQSDDLDEIDWELLGAAPTEAQTNYFGRGVTETYDREFTVSAPTSTTEFNTYVIDWNQDRIIWSINGVALRTLNAANADVDSSGRSEYPQTPMQVKIGAWAGGDPSNPSGTISWAGGQINYGAGPYSMIVKSVSVQDYSTGSTYSYNAGGNGSWHDITAANGAVLGGSSGSGSSASSAASSKPVASSTSTSAAASVASSSANVAASGSSTLPSSYETFPTSTSVVSSSSVNTRTGWPWVATSTAAAGTSSAAAAATSNIMSYSSAGSSSSVAAAASSGASSAQSMPAGYSSQGSGAATSVAGGAASSQASGAASSATAGAGSATTMVTYATSVTTVNAGGASASTGSGSSSGSGSGSAASSAAYSVAAAGTSASAAAQSQGASSSASGSVPVYTGGAEQVTVAKIGIAICAVAGLALAA